MNTIYIRTLKRAEHTVFCVEKGQKTYYDPQFNSYVPYSSGQQVKRSLIDELMRWNKLSPDIALNPGHRLLLVDPDSYKL